jgi:hypothetical protein
VVSLKCSNQTKDHRMTKMNVPFLDEIRNLIEQTDLEFLRTVISEQLHQLGIRCYRTHGCLQILAEPQSGQLPERAAQSTLRYARRDHRPPDSNVACRIVLCAMSAGTQAVGSRPHQRVCYWLCIVVHHIVYISRRVLDFSCICAFMWFNCGSGISF